MEEAPKTLANLASLESQTNEAYACYMSLTKSTQKLKEAGEALCKASQAVTTSLKAPSLASGAGGQVLDICSTLEMTVSLLSSLYSMAAQKPALKATHDLIADKRRKKEAAERKHHDVLQRACTMKSEDRSAGKADAEVCTRKHDSEVKRLEFRQSLEQGMLNIQHEHAAIISGMVRATASTPVHPTPLHGT